MKQAKSLLSIIAGMFAVAFVMASCETQVEPASEPATITYTVTYSSEYGTTPKAITVEENTVLRKWYESFGAVHIGTKKFDFFPFTCGYLQKEV